MSVKLFHLHNETNASCPDFKGQNYKASFHTRSSAKGPRKKIYRAHLDGEGPRKGELAVVKVFRYAPGTEAMCDAEITKHIMARKMARKFNKTVPNPADKITFTLPLKSTVDKFGMGNYLIHHSRHLDKQEWVLIEENLVTDSEQKFDLLLRKNGERVGKDPTSLDAFVHFTFLESGQSFVMCGFQGVHSDKDGYKLTTPYIHSTQEMFGQTDKGPSGIRSVFANHRCNNLCYQWPKPKDELSEEQDTLPTSENDTDDGLSSGDELETEREDSTVTFRAHTPSLSSENMGLHSSQEDL